MQIANDEKVMAMANFGQDRGLCTIGNYWNIIFQNAGGKPGLTGQSVTLSKARRWQKEDFVHEICEGREEIH